MQNYKYIYDKLNLLKDKEKDIYIINELIILFDIANKLYNKDYNLGNDIYKIRINNYDTQINEIYVKILELFTILAYYINLKKEGLIISDKLILNKKYPINKSMIINNIKYYLTPLSNILEIKKEKIKLLNNYSNDDNHMNFSIINNNNEYICIFRYVNYIINNNGEFIFENSSHAQTNNHYVKLDNNFNVISQKQIIDKSSNIKYNSRWKGLEDAIIFKVNDELWFSCTSPESNINSSPQINLCKLDKDYNVDFKLLINSPFGKMEKNWLPFYENNTFNFYRCGYHDDFSIISIDYSDVIISNTNNIIIKRKNYPLDFSRFKGSAGPLKFNDGYLFIIHETIPGNNSKYYYYNRFIYTDKDYTIKKLSIPFKFENSIVEFCRSMCYQNEDNSNIIITVSIEDSSSYLYIVNILNIFNLLKDIDYFTL